MGLRDEFSADIKRNLANRVGLRCSNPECRASTAGPQSDPAGAVNIGVAAHITAAAAGGPRFDSTITPEERSAATNGIWLCQNCAKRIDNDPTRYPADLLWEWKLKAESRADSELGRPAITAATEYAELDRRPWVGIRAIHMDPLTPGKPPRAEMVIRNRGKTPAMDLVLHGFIVTSPHRIYDPEAEVAKGLSETPAAEIPTIGALLPDEDTTIPFTSSFNLTEGMVAAFQAAAGHIYLIGRIEYRDVFAKQHVTRYFRHYLPSANRFESENPHNDAE